MNFREARPDDAATLGALHVASWRETYAGTLPTTLLAGLSTQARSSMWSAVISDPVAAGGTTVFVAERESRIIGFGACGVQRDKALKNQGFVGEIGAVYVLRAYQGVGVGTGLMALMARKLVDQSRRAASLWVLRENVAARRFYERLGGVVMIEREDEQLGTKLTEVAYGWSDLSQLIR